MLSKVAFVKLLEPVLKAAKSDIHAVDFMTSEEVRQKFGVAPYSENVVIQWRDGRQILVINVSCNSHLQILRDVVKAL